MAARGEIERLYGEIRKQLKKRFWVCHSALKVNSREIARYFKVLYDICIGCVESEKKRQILIEKHCSTSSVTLRLHESYHEESDNLRDGIITFFGQVKTFLNQFAAYLSRTSLSQVSGVRFKSFHSLLDSISGVNDTTEMLKSVSEFSGHIRGALDFRDKYLEHPGKTYAFQVQSIPYNGSSIIAYDATPATPDESSLETLAKIQSFDRDTLLHVNTLGCKPLTDGLNFYYHVRRPPKANLLNPPVAPNYHVVGPGQELFEVHDETEIHFLEYGPHSHSFTDPDLVSLDSKIFDPEHRLDTEKNLYLPIKNRNRMSPNYLWTFAILTDFLIRISTHLSYEDAT